MKLEVDIVVSKDSKKEIDRVLKDIEDKSEDILAKIVNSIPTQVGKTFDAMYQDVGKGLNKLGSDLGKTAQDALADSLSPIFHGEMDKVEDIWGKAWDNMIASAQKQLAALPTELAKTAIQLPYNIFKEAVWDPEKWFKDNVTDTVKGWGGSLKNWVVEKLGGIKKPADDYHRPAVYLAAA